MSEHSNTAQIILSPDGQSVAARPVEFLHDLYNAGLEAADPIICLPPYLHNINPKGRIIVIGAGKAASSMVQAVENTWHDKDIEGIVVTRYGYELPSKKIEIVQASHPVPDEAGEIACKRILEKLSDLSEDDFVLFLISGGGSALLSMPVPCLSSEEKRAINKALLKSGARIHEMNCVRKHLSRIKGGQLAMAAHPAKSLSLIVSDVPGDDLDVIASGPTVPDNSTQKQALEIIHRYNIPVSAAIKEWLNDPANETPKPGSAFDHHQVEIIAKPQHMIDKAAAFAKIHGVETILLSDRVEGEARDVAIEQIAMAVQRIDAGKPDESRKPCVIISGGEATVTIKGEGGKGGPNTEFALSAIIAAAGNPHIYGLSCDTDGIDGSEDNAGAFFTPDSLKIAKDNNIDLQAYLDTNDSYTCFQKLETLIITGPTYTNVNDFRAILVL